MATCLTSLQVPNCDRISLSPRPFGTGSFPLVQLLRTMVPSLGCSCEPVASPLGLCSGFGLLLCFVLLLLANKVLKAVCLSLFLTVFAEPGYHHALGLGASLLDSSQDLLSSRR